MQPGRSAFSREFHIRHRFLSTIIRQMQRSEMISVNSTISADYTYHRHSAPKDVVYYRCSDKRCKARLHFNRKTQEITLKNRHLDPEVHKRPKLTGVVAIDALPSVETERFNGFKGPAPLLVEEKREDLGDLKCLEALPALEPQRVVRLLSGPSDELTNVHFSVDSIESGRKVCEEAINRRLARQACFMEKGQVFFQVDDTMEVQPCGVRIALEVEKPKLPSLHPFLQQLLGYRPDTECFITVDDTNVT